MLPWDCEAKARAQQHRLYAPGLKVDQLIGLNGKDFLLSHLQNLQMTPPLFFRNFLRRGGSSVVKSSDRTTRRNDYTTGESEFVEI